MLINECGGIVYFVVDDNEEVLHMGDPVLAPACDLLNRQSSGRLYLLPTMCLYVFKSVLFCFRHS